MSMVVSQPVYYDTIGYNDLFVESSPYDVKKNVIRLM